MDPNENVYSGVMPKTEEAGIFPPETPPGMAYVPLQRFGKVYEPDTALVKGTIFPELYKPWYGSRPANLANISNVNMSPMETMNTMGTMNSKSTMGTMSSMNSISPAGAMNPMSPTGTMSAMNPMNTMNTGAAVSSASNPVMEASSNSNDMYLKYLGYNNLEGSSSK